MDYQSNAKMLTQLEERLGRHKEAGLVDLNVMTSRDRNMSTLGLLWTLNNAFRLEEEGKVTVTEIR